MIKKSGKIKRLLFIIAICFLCIAFIFISNDKTALAMPYYNLRPSEIVVRSSFYTTYSDSSEERKHNIALAVSSLNNTFIDVGSEFSFNRVVGARTESRGYKISKIIKDGQFTDGVGGGVCQVSTTLYNAVLLAGLKITEYHPHSLPVSYIAPSFDAMVNSGSADLRFVNNTFNPIIICAFADGDTVRVKVYGEKNKYKITRESVIKEIIPAPKEQVVYDDKKEYTDLYYGEQRFLSYSKQGLKSEGYLIKELNGKTLERKKIRSDTYFARRGIVVIGRTERVEG